MICEEASEALIFVRVENRELLSKSVARQIEEAIQSKKLPLGDKLPAETDLATQFGVSRTAIREALRIVSAKGLIRIEKGRGIFVIEPSSDSVTDPIQLYLKYNMEHNYALDLIHSRQIIEPSIAASAALNRTDEDVVLLKSDIETLIAYDSGFDGLANLDLVFHLHIAKATQSRLIPLILEPIHKLMPEIKKSVYKTNDDAKESAVIWHQKIVDQIVAGDSDGAFRAMKQHLEIAEKHIKVMLQSVELSDPLQK